VRRNGQLFSEHPYALNEVAVLKHDNSSLIGIEAKIDGGLLNHYMADGLIITTPTGSTGYSLSVGGPILAPMSGTLCISPVASHSLNTRPVVVTDNVCIEMKVESRSHNYLIAIDGRSESLPCTDLITVTKAPFKIGVAKIERKNFYDTLREKMAWGRRG
jgi:NAD+ kinase